MSDAIASSPAPHSASADPLSRVTILIHTANRPDQLYRLLRYYAAVPGIDACTIVVADGSDAANRAAFDSRMETASFELAYILQRYAPELPFPDRLRQALDDIKTPCTMLAADDDFYFLDWVRDHVGLLDVRDDVTAIKGNYLVFGLGDFTAFSDTVRIADGGPERFSIPWLEDETVEARLGEVGGNPHGLQNTAWYALHRTEALGRILKHGSQYDLPILLFERYFAVAQAALGKTVFTPDIFLGRQADANPADAWWRTEPMGVRTQQHALTELKTCTAAFLSTQLGYEPAEAKALAIKVFAHEFAMMRQADRRRWLRRIVNRTGIRRWLNAMRGTAPLPLRDPRLPQRCDPTELQRRGEQVRRACTPD